MAIAFDATANGEKTGTSTLSFSHTCTGSNRILFVGVVSQLGSDNLTGVTYNGVTLTQINKIQNNGGIYSYLYYLIAPATGANNVVVSYTGSTQVNSISVSYTGVAQISPINNSTTNNSGASSVSSLTTSLVSNSSPAWMIQLGTGQTNDGTTAGTGLTKRNGGAGGSPSSMFDSNTSTGSGSYSGTWNNNVARTLTSLVASFSDITSSQSTFLMFL